MKSLKMESPVTGKWEGMKLGLETEMTKRFSEFLQLSSFALKIKNKHK